MSWRRRPRAPRPPRPAGEPRPKRNQPEKLEQAHCQNLLRSIGGRVYTLGSRRAARCAHCGEYSTDMSTRQSPGLFDIWAFLPRPKLKPGGPTGLWWEVKAPGGTSSDDQDTFAAECQAAGIAHGIGGVLELTAFLIDGGWLLADNVPHYRRPPTPAAPAAGVTHAAPHRKESPEAEEN